jgi:tRNA nucleotidyltransferase (CCA-adding enzyme)
LRALAARLKVPTDHAELAELVCREHLNAHRALELKPVTVLKLLTAFDALRRPERLQVLLITCTADKRGRLGHALDDYPQATWLQRARDAAASITAAPFVAEGLHGPAIGAAMEKARVQAIGDGK